MNGKYLMLTLNDLHVDDELRNTPLIELECEYKTISEKNWMPLTPAFNIAKKTFNELGDVWTKQVEWRTNKEDIWDEKRMDIIGQNGGAGENYFEDAYARVEHDYKK